MAMPRKLKLMNVFLNGYSYQGVAKSVTLPKLTRKLENYRGAGMNGSAPVDLGLDDDALSMEWSLGGLRSSPSAWLLVGQIFTRKHRLKCQALSAS